jgi:hypothetical protein
VYEKEAQAKKDRQDFRVISHDFWFSGDEEEKRARRRITAPQKHLYMPLQAFTMWPPLDKFIIIGSELINVDTFHLK